MGQLTAIAENVWGYEDTVAPALGFRMPARATVVRLANGDLVLHSPLAIDDELARALAALGPVKHIVAPSCLHWLHVKAAQERYREARVLAAPGLEPKLERVEHIDADSFGAELRIERVAGAPSLDEHVFLHTPSRSLIVTDLVFNIRSGASVGMSMVLWVNGAYQKTAQSRVWRFSVKDRAAAAASATRILDWDFERVVVGHGDVIAEDARERMRAALDWMVRAPGARPATTHAA